MDNKKFSKDLLEKIKKENIKQTPKYVFLLKNTFVWLFFIISILIGAISLSISFDYLINADWDIFRRVGFIEIFILFLPLFWVFLLILSSFLGFLNYRNTNKGYKLSFIKIFIINLLSSFLLAGILYSSGLTNYIETKIENLSPKYRELLVEDKVSRMMKVWQNEDNGLLIGEILDLKKGKIILLDINNKTWNISIENTFIKSRVILEIGEQIKIVGEKNSENNFDAFEIRPFMGMNNMGAGMGKGNMRMH